MSDKVERLVNLTVALLEAEMAEGAFTGVIHCYSSSPELGFEAWAPRVLGLASRLRLLWRRLDRRTGRVVLTF